MIFEDGCIENTTFSLPEGSPKEVKLDAKTYTPKKYPKSDQNCSHMTPIGNPGGGPRSHFFALFEPRGTPGDPQAPQRSPLSSKEASKRQFGVIFAPFFTHFRPILLQIFWTFWLRFHTFSTHFASNFLNILASIFICFSTAPNKQTNKQTNEQTKHTHTHTAKGHS